MTATHRMSATGNTGVLGICLVILSVVMLLPGATADETPVTDHVEQYALFFVR